MVMKKPKYLVCPTHMDDEDLPNVFVLALTEENFQKLKTMTEEAKKIALPFRSIDFHAGPGDWYRHDGKWADKMTVRNTFPKDMDPWNELDSENRDYGEPIDAELLMVDAYGSISPFAVMEDSVEVFCCSFMLTENGISYYDEEENHTIEFIIKEN